MAYPWAVKVRPDWDKSEGISRLKYTKSLGQLPDYFGGGYAKGTAVAAYGLDRVYLSSGMFGNYYYYGTGLFLHKRGWAQMADGGRAIPEVYVAANTNGYGGVGGVRPLIVSQRNGRFMYYFSLRGDGGGQHDPDWLFLTKMWGPDASQMQSITIPNGLSNIAPVSASGRPTWTIGSDNSGYVTDHDRSPMMWLQSSYRTMALLDNASWWGTFGLRNWYSDFGSGSPDVYQGYSWAFYQEHTNRPSTAICCRIMPPKNRYSAPELWWFVTKGAKYTSTGTFSGYYDGDVEVYRARWKADQWRPLTDWNYAETQAAAAAVRYKPVPTAGGTDYIRDKVNPNRMGFDQSWYQKANLVGTLRGLRWGGNTNWSGAINTFYVDRDRDGTAVVMGHGFGPRMSAVAGSAYRLSKDGFRLTGVVQPAPALNTTDGGGLYASNATTSQAQLIHGIPTFLAQEYLTTTGIPVGVGQIEGRGTIYQRGELNRESWLV